MTAQRSLDEARERLRPYVERARANLGRMGDPPSVALGPEAPWDYMTRAQELIANAGSVLDMGTGDGVRFAQLLDDFHGRVCATEEWDASAPIARDTLRPLGAHVVRCRSHHFPFRDSTFDLVLNRHEELTPAEIARVLQPGGHVLTQQCLRYWPEINRFITRNSYAESEIESYGAGFLASGMQILFEAEHEVSRAYESLGDVVDVICLDPWWIPDFDPLGQDLEALLELELACTSADGLVLSDGSHIIEAVKPA